MEYLGLGSMNLSIKELEPLLLEFGKCQISEEEGKLIEEKMEERDKIIERNSKVKDRKKKLEPVPEAIKFEKDEKGGYYKILKPNFKHLNIGYNDLDGTALEKLDKLLERTLDNFLITVPSKHLEKEQYTDLVGKYDARIIY